MQHPTNDNCGNERGVNVIDENVAPQRRIKDLPNDYKNVPPVVLKTNDPVIPKLIGPIMSQLAENASSLSKELDWTGLTKLSLSVVKMN